MKKTRFALFILAVCALAALISAPFIGMGTISPTQLLTDPMEREIFFTLRIPRVIIAFIAGGSLAVCGMVFQAMFRNPLATPHTLGVSSGASFGAALIILLGWTGMSGLSLNVTFGAFLGALGAMTIVYGLASVHRVASNLTILLAGVAVGFFFSSLLMMVQFASSLRHSFQILRWLMGGLDVFGYESIYSIMPILLPGLLIIAWKLPELDHFMTGEDIAAARGVHVKRTKTLLYFGTSLTVSTIVSVCGPIGFIGMMAPHICRLFFGNNHRVLGPASFLFGGAFLVAADTVARTILAPTEIPVGVITALCGGPFFLWLLFVRMKPGNKSVFS